MYIWVALDLSSALSSLRSRAMLENRTIGLSEVAFSLPQHISLKISFSVDDGVSDQVIGAISEALKDIAPFSVALQGLERLSGLLWVRAREDMTLRTLHERLDTLLSEQFGIEQHPFDSAFAFHSTLFQDENEAGLDRMMTRLSDALLPACVTPDGFLIGISPSGKAGSFSVVSKIPFSLV